MGALSEAMDSYLAKVGYFTARDEYNKLKSDYDLDGMTRADLRKLLNKSCKKYKDDRIEYDFKANLEYFLNLDIKTYYIFYDWTFGDEKDDSIEKIKKICDKTEGLSYKERLSTDNDFFLFRPEEHGEGIDIFDKLNRPPLAMYHLFKGVLCSKLEFKHLEFRF